jgi:hypothetical protein
MFKRLIILWALIFMSLCIWALCTTSEADVLELKEASATYTKYHSNNRSAYFPQAMKDGLQMQIKSDILTYGFFNSRVHGTTDDGQYRQIGLEVDLGVRLTKYFDVFYNHHSQHLLDTTDSYGRGFPVSDSINVKLYFYRSK